MNPVLDWHNVQLLVTSSDHTRTYPARRIEDGPSGAVRIQADMVRVDAGAVLSVHVGLCHPRKTRQGGTAAAVSWNIIDQIEPALWPWVVVNFHRPEQELVLGTQRSLSELTYV